MRTLKAAFAAAGVLAVAACSSTTYNSTWKAPDAGPLQFKAQDKVVALIMSEDQASRLGAEDALARELTKRGVQGVPANTILKADVKDREQAKAAFEAAGAAGVVAMRVVASEKEISQTPGMWYSAPYYGSFWGGYYGYGWGAAYSPGTIRTDTIVSVETLVYDLKQNKLVWAGRSATTNPSKVNDFIKELVAEAAKEMRKAGLIPSAS